MIAFKRKPRATTYSNLRAGTHSSKRVAKSPRNVSEETRGCTWKRLVWIYKREGNLRWNWNAENNIRTKVGYKRKIVCFLHRLVEGIWPWKFDQWMQMLMGNDTEWLERRFIIRLHWDQSVKPSLGQGETRSMKPDGGVRRLCRFHWF
jgi:hypothetical protein